ncbi:DgyrCDS4717 [Dimorphilus gyrociliatus]|uniref:Coiled-coil domain-containing protein 25 n=1 Tax=Dimorphilus gyrociliatus TaxID=2664684 RepID=A0A7I8VKG3_9ANNE|nr:DgyrCDS4717 [Dimorphilus gyrociliatus]
MACLCNCCFLIIVLNFHFTFTADQSKLGKRQRDSDDETEEIDVETSPPPRKRITPFTNTPIEKKEERRRLLRTCQSKIKKLKGYDETLHRRLLINSVTKRVMAEMRRDKMIRKCMFEEDYIAHFDEPVDKIQNDDYSEKIFGSDTQNSPPECSDKVVQELYERMQIFFPELDSDNDVKVEDQFSTLSADMDTPPVACKKMVLYFVSNAVSPSYTIYMGEDKFENEHLIKWGWPEDVWFHVDKLSSAHVYLRLRKNETLDDVPQDVIIDCAQLVKANSIQGNKMNDIDVVYTMWENLKKTGGMEVGQVGFHREKEVRKIRVEKRTNEIVNRLNKTKVDKKDVDLQAEREERDRKEREVQKAKLREQKKREKEEEEKRQKELEVRSYKSLMKSENMTSNQDDGNDSDDFM